MNKAQLIELRKKEHEEKFGKFRTGKFHVLNPSPTNELEAIQHGNAMAASGNYPVGTSGCFNVGISGGCGPECFVYLNGDCDEPDAMIERLDPSELTRHHDIYRKKEIIQLAAQQLTEQICEVSDIGDLCEACEGLGHGRFSGDTCLDCDGTGLIPFNPKPYDEDEGGGLC